MFYYVFLYFFMSHSHTQKEQLARFDNLLLIWHFILFCNTITNSLVTVFFTDAEEVLDNQAESDECNNFSPLVDIGEAVLPTFHWYSFSSPSLLKINTQLPLCHWKLNNKLKNNCRWCCNKYFIQFIASFLLFILIAR